MSDRHYSDNALAGQTTSQACGNRDAWRFVKWARAVEGLTVSESKILCYVAGSLWAGGAMSPRGWHPGRGAMTISTIAAACGVSERTVQRALQTFELHGLLLRQRRYWLGDGKISTTRGRQVSNAYALPQHAIAAAAALSRRKHNPSTNRSKVGIEPKELPHGGASTRGVTFRGDIGVRGDIVEGETGTKFIGHKWERSK